MLRYGTYIFGGEYSLYVVIDDGACLVPQPDRTNAKCVFRVIGVDIFRIAIAIAIAIIMKKLLF